MRAAMQFLSLRAFATCPEFEFEPCEWRFIPYETRGDSVFDSNTEFVHRCFDAHVTRFSNGLEALLRSQAAMEPFGMTFLPLTHSASDRAVAEVDRRVLRPASASQRARGGYRFDVAISFAGTERPLAEQLAQAARAEGFSVFYDAFYPEELWGKDLVVHFDQIYRKNARYCAILISQAYVEREWTNHERRSAQARLLAERGGEYILPIKVDGSELPGMPPTIGYLSLAEVGIESITELLVRKLRAPS
jgi:hypothetical protein